MTMKKKTNTVGAGEFKAKCLALLDEVSESGRHVVITKRGRPVAEVVPVRDVPSLEGSIVREGDLISPLDETWNAGA
jgi:prevent-host-death family protein